MQRGNPNRTEPLLWARRRWALAQQAHHRRIIGSKPASGHGQTIITLIHLIIMDTESVCVANNAACIDPTRRIRHNQIAGAAY
jgi:hypothetical protein